MSCSFVAAREKFHHFQGFPNKKEERKIHRPRRTIFFFFSNSLPNSERPHRKGLLKKLYLEKKNLLYLSPVKIFTAIFILF